MKYMFIVIALLLFITCTTTKKEVLYELPAEMLPHVKTHYAQQCDRGYELWKQNCSRCHIQKIDGKKAIPDFKAEQLTGYTLRTQNKRHETNLPDSVLSEEDLSIIMTFLTYKKKNTVK